MTRPEVLPNILIVMVDQLTGTLFPDGPAPWLVTPNLARLTERSVRFANCYTASPLCAPGRGGFMTSRLPSATGIYDNAAEFRAELPTFAHLMRRAGWRTCLSGKMHFVGPDQLHGFEERLTTDIYPADFGWTPDWRKPGERIDWWYHNLGSVTQAGVAEITNQLEYDDEVGFMARQWLYDAARGADERPWCLTVSFTHPHDPYVARRRDWELYEGCAHLLPEVPALPYESHDPHSQRIFDANDWRSYQISDTDIARARRAYFANISYLDRQIGEIFQVLEDTGQEAIVIFCSDHGDMLGERGLWFKMSFFEGSARVPLMIAAPELAPARIEAPVSLMDLGPTLLELLGIEAGDAAEWWDGRSLLPLVAGGERGAPVAMEYAAEASVAPMVALIEDGWKYTRCPVDPEQLFDLSSDPHELDNLAADPAHADRLAAFRAKADAMWDLDRFEAEVRDSQARRLIVYEALRRGGYYPWDYQPLKDASERFMRNHKDLNVLEERQRFPRGE